MKWNIHTPNCGGRDFELTRGVRRPFISSRLFVDHCSSTRQLLFERSSHSVVVNQSHTHMGWVGYLLLCSAIFWKAFCQPQRVGLLLCSIIIIYKYNSISYIYIYIIYFYLFLPFPPPPPPQERKMRNFVERYIVIRSPIEFGFFKFYETTVVVVW